MNEMKMPNEEELAKVVYNYCKSNNIKHIREDELVRRIVDDNMDNHLGILKNSSDLDKNCLKEDSKLSNEIINKIGNHILFTYKLSKRLYDIIDILIEENKASREKREGERLYYLTFYLTPLEIESIKLIKSSIEILSDELYNYCKTNNIKWLNKEEVKKVINIDDDKMIDKVIDALVKKNMAKIYCEEDKSYFIFYIKESMVAINKNFRLMIKNSAEMLLDYCIQNEIECIEKVKLQKIMEMDDDEVFDAILDYLVERHLADVDYNSEDGNEYITMYY